MCFNGLIFFLRKHLRAMYIINTIKLLFSIEEVFLDFQNLIDFGVNLKIIL